MPFCQVIVDINHTDVDHVFTYRVPAGLDVCPGMRVHVPFGPRKLEGVVVEMAADCDLPPERVKDICDTLEDYPAVLPPLLADDAMMVCLVKPQFEAGREKVGKHGVVRDPATHIEVLERAVGFAKKSGFGIVGIEFSPIKGPQGNIEYLMVLSRSKPELDISGDDIRKLVESSHDELDKKEASQP